MSTFVVPLQDLQQPITQDMLVDDGLVLNFVQTIKRGLAGGPATMDLTLENPGLVLLSKAGYLAVVDTPTGLLADAIVLGRARMARIPDDLGGLRVTLRMQCGPASWKSLVRIAANNSVKGAGIAPYQVPTVPDPGQGILSVAFAASPTATWAAIGKNAIAVEAHFQQDLTRSPFSSLMNFNTLSVANAVLTVTVADGPVIRDAAKYKRAAIVAVSGDRDPTHGVPFAAGVVSTIRPAPGGKVDVVINLASTNLATAGIVPVTYGDTTAAALPFFDALFPGPRSDLSTAVIEGRTSTWYIDPVTHEILLDDWLHGQRLVDLGDLGVASSERRAVVKSAVRHVRLKVVVEFTQTAVGSINVAPIVSLAGNFGAFQTLAYSIGGFPASATGGDSNLGWTQSSPRVTQSQALGPTIWTGRTFAVKYREDTMYWNYFNDEFGRPKAQNYWIQGTEYEVEHAEQAVPVINTVSYISWLFAYNYTQTRREVCDLVLDVDGQDFALGEGELDLGTIQIQDPNSLEGIAPYVDGVAYNKGDRVLVKGRVYECVADRVVSFYKLTTVKRNGTWTTTQTTPYWRDLGYSTPMGDPRRPSYFDSFRGRGTLEAALMRMRAAAMRRLCAIRIRKTFPWAVARHLTLRDEVRMLVRDGRRTIPVRGRVEELVKRIEGKGVAAVDVTITVMAGTGRNDPLDAVGKDFAQAGVFATGVATTAPKPTYVSDSVPGYVVAGTVNGDVEYALSADTLFTPIDVYRLSDLNYSVLSVQYKNSAQEQLAYISATIASGKSPQKVSQDYPSTLDVTMRPIRSDGNLIRNYTCHAQLTSSPRGVDFTNGAEP